MKRNSEAKILLIDSYDSFTYNLVHLIHECGAEVEVWKNDAFELGEVEAFDKILLSPGPGIPKDAGQLIDVVSRYGSSKSILGVCLGHQAIGEAFGAHLRNLERPFHGIATKMRVTDSEDALFRAIPAEFSAGRYHSWVIAEDGFPDELRITAKDEQGNIMAIAHREYKVRGVQFHPESILSEYGKELIQNWLEN